MTTQSRYLWLSILGLATLMVLALLGVLPSTGQLSRAARLMGQGNNSISAAGETLKPVTLAGPLFSKQQTEPAEPPDIDTTLPTSDTFALYLPLLSRTAFLFLPGVAVSSGIGAPHPAHGASGQSPNAYLAWKVIETEFVPVRYTLFLEKDDASPDDMIASNLNRTNFDPATFDSGARYFWRVMATDAAGETLMGPVWSFVTEDTTIPPATDAMVTVPGGAFLMGCDRTNPAEIPCVNDLHHLEEPLHWVTLETFALDKYEVTNGEYRACVAANACSSPRRFRSHLRDNYFLEPTYADYPVLFVSHWDAEAFCRWEGKRLPTEAEWEKAARGDIDTRVWPWGNERPDCTRVNYTNDLKTDENGEGWIVCAGDTARVGSYPAGASPYGAMDMGGNVWEWVADKYDVYYYPVSPAYNPLGPTRSRTIKNKPPFGLFFSIRGGSYRPSWRYVRVAFRHFGHHGDGVNSYDEPYYRNDQVGFRCAVSLPGQ